MKRVVDKIIELGRLAVVIVALLALVVSGASAAERLFQPDPQPTTDEAPKAASLDHNPGPDDKTDKMSPDGRPWTDPPAYLQSALGVPAGPDQNRETFLDRDCLPASWVSRHSSLLQDPLGTTALVDSHVGQRFTLVGSKPSGTS